MRQFMGALALALREIAGAAAEVNPFIASRDLLNRWGTYRLRRHPFQVLPRIAGLGGVVCLIYYVGGNWLTPPLVRMAATLTPFPMANEILERTAGALFSSLNIISCLSVAAIWGDLRRMAREEHLESLQVVPGRLSAPAVYYGVAVRYLPLALIAVLIFFLDQRASPFRRFPFGDEWLSVARSNPVYPDDPYSISVEERMLLDRWTVYWPLISAALMLVFCVVNFWLDTIIGFAVFCRFKLSLGSLAAAVLIVGAVTPIFFMGAIMVIQRRFAPVLNTTPQSLKYILDTYYFLFGSAASAIVGFGLLVLTALRWRRLQSSGKEDPVLLRVSS